MKRRHFITLLGSGMVAWPLAARAQQGDRVRRIGLLMPYDENDPEQRLRLSAFIRRADAGSIEPTLPQTGTEGCSLRA